MTELSLIELILLGGILALVLLWLGPGLRGAFRQSAEARERDWAGVLLPIALVVLFVVGMLWVAGR